MYINEFYFRETLSVLENGFLKTEIPKIISITFANPLKVTYLSDDHKVNFDFFYVENYIPKNDHIKSTQFKNKEIIKNIGHLNVEEKETIETICKEFKDIFHKKILLKLYQWKEPLITLCRVAKICRV